LTGGDLDRNKPLGRQAGGGLAGNGNPSEQVGARSQRAEFESSRRICHADRFIVIQRSVNVTIEEESVSRGEGFACPADPVSIDIEKGGS